LLVLDPTRLGNQIYRECKTLVNGSWKHHPVSKMWQPYLYSLCDYALIGLEVLRERGRYYPHHITWFKSKQKEFKDTGRPWFIGIEAFHLSHRLNLLFKLPGHYTQYFQEPVPKAKPEYYWPVRLKK